jgi:hypothetical protein
MMTKNSILFSTLAIVFVTISIAAREMDQEEKLVTVLDQANATEMQSKIFDKAMNTIVDGNDLWWWFMTRNQSNPSPEFEKTCVVEFKEDGTYSESFSLDDLKKVQYSFDKNCPGYRAYKIFERHAKANNAIHCSGLIRVSNRDGKLKDVAVLIAGTQCTSHCEHYKQWLKSKESLRPEEN